MLATFDCEQRHPVEALWKRGDDIWLDRDGPVTPFDRLPASVVDTNLFESFRALAELDPDGVAAMDGDIPVTRGILLHRANAVALRLVQATTSNDRVAITLPHSVDFVVAILACMAAGRVYVALDTRYPEARNRSIVSDFDPGCVLCKGFCAITESTPSAVILDISAVEPSTEALILLPIAMDAPAVVLYTSGSTGLPKGVVNSQRAIAQRAYAQVNAGHFSRDDVNLCVASPCTIAGTREVFSALLSGATLLMVDPELEGLRGVRRLIKDRGVTLVYAVPSLVRAILANGRFSQDFTSIRILRMGGEPVTWDDVDLAFRALRKGALVQIGYSSTETTGTQRFVVRNEARIGAGPSVGRFDADTQYALLDETGCRVRDDEGELVIRSRFVTRGYWKQGRCDPHGIVSIDEAGVGTFRTGDMACLEPDGSLRVIGRADRQIKINGRRVEPGEIETILKGARGVDDAIVLPVATASDLAIVGFFATRGDPDEVTSSVRRRLRDFLPHAWHPKRLHALPALPKLSGGKIDAMALRALDNKSTMSVSTGAHEDVDGAVAEAWAAVLRRRGPFGTASWDHVGGDSLKLLQLVFELEERLDRRLPLETFRLDMSVAQMAAALVAPKAINSMNNERPSVVLLPGLQGDSPALVSLRSDLRDYVNFVVAEYPTWRAMAVSNPSIGSIADSVATAVQGAMPIGPVRMIGYSLGGAVAYEVAKRLIANGRFVDWFVILDTNVAQARGGANARLRKALELIASLAGESTCSELIARGTASVLAAPPFKRVLGRLAVGDLPQHLPSPLRFAFEGEMCEAMQRRAMDLWIASRPSQTVPLRAYLFRSDQRASDVPEDLGWRTFLDDVVVVPAKGDHRNMIRLPHRVGLVERLALMCQALRCDPGQGVPVK